MQAKTTCWARTLGSKWTGINRERDAGTAHWLKTGMELSSKNDLDEHCRGFLSLLILLPPVHLLHSILSPQIRPHVIKGYQKHQALHLKDPHTQREPDWCLSIFLSKEKRLIFLTLGLVQSSKPLMQPHEGASNSWKKNTGPMIQKHSL